MVPGIGKWALMVSGIAGILALSGCGSSAAKASPSASAGVTVGAGSILHTHGSPIGTVLTTTSGMTLYVFSANTPGHLACDAACLVHWPAYTVAAGASLKGPGGVTLSTVKMSAGEQLTVNGEPVYTFVGDSAPGQVNGEGLNVFGGIWYALHVNGTVDTGSSATPSTPTSTAASPSSSPAPYSYGSPTQASGPTASASSTPAGSGW